MDSQEPTQSDHEKTIHGSSSLASSLIAGDQASTALGTVTRAQVIKTYKQSTDLDACHLGTQSLRELEDLMTEGLTPEERERSFRVSVDLREVQLQATSLTALLADPQLPDRIGRATV